MKLTQDTEEINAEVYKYKHYRNLKFYKNSKIEGLFYLRQIEESFYLSQNTDVQILEL